MPPLQPDLQRTLADLGASFQDFKAQYDARLRDVENLSARMEILGGSTPPADLERRGILAGLGHFARQGTKGLPDIQAAAEIGLDPKGGLLVPEANLVIAKLEQPVSPIRSVARVVEAQTDHYSVVVDRGGTAAGWTSEIGARPETASPDLARVRIPIAEIYASPSSTQRELDDAGVSVGSWLESSIVDRFAEVEGAAFVNGDGVNKPRGILTYATSPTPDATRAFGELQYTPTGDANGFLATSTTVSPADVLISCMHSLRSKYRSEGATWLLNSATLSVVRRWKDADGHFIWQPALAAGQPSLLLGYPVVEAEDFPDIAAGAYPIAFGAWQRGYYIADRLGVRIVRDGLTAKPYVQFYSTKRVGGGLVDSQAIKLVKVAVS